MKQLKSKTKLVARFLLVAVIGLSVLSGCKSYDKEIDGLNADISTLKTDLQTLKTQTEANLAARVAELNSKITELTTSINGLNTKIAELTASSATKAEVAALEAKVDAQKTELLNTLATKASLEAYKTTTDARLASIDAKIAALEAKKTVTPEELAAAKAELDGKIQATNTALSELSAKVTNLETTLTQKDKDLAFLIGQLDARTATLEGLVALKADKTYVDQVRDNLITKLGELKAELIAADAAQKAAITTYIDGKIAAANTRMDNLKTSIDANTAEINALKSKVSGLETSLAALTNRITTAEGKIEDIYTKIATLATKAELQALTDRVIANEQNIAKLQKDLKDVEKDLETLQNDLDIKFFMLSHRLTSMEFVSDAYINGIEAMEFVSMRYPKCNIATNNLSKNRATDFFNIMPDIKLEFHLNPSSVKKDDINTENLKLKFIKGRNVSTGFYATETAENVTVKFVEINNGKLVISLSYSDYANIMDINPNVSGNVETFWQAALEVTLAQKHWEADPSTGVKETATVISEYVRLHQQTLYSTPRCGQATDPTWNDVTIIRKGGNRLAYQLSDAKAQDVAGIDGKTLTNALVVSLPYNTELNLEDYIAVKLNYKNGMTSNMDAMTRFGLTYKFDLLEGNCANGDSGNAIVYDRGSNDTDQQKFINITDANKGTIKAKVFSQAEIEAAQGRTPIVRVTVFNNSLSTTCPAMVGYIKIHLEDKPRPEPIATEIDLGETDALCAANCFLSTVQQMNELVYNKAAMSKTTFHTAYPFSTSLQGQLITSNGKPTGINATANYGVISEYFNPDGQTTDSYLLQWCLSAQELWNALSTNSTVTIRRTVKFTPIIPAEHADVYVTLKLKVKRPAERHFGTADLLSNYWYTDNMATLGEGKPYLIHNTPVPQTGQTSSSSVAFENNINQAFVQNANKQLAALTNGYEYFFYKNITLSHAGGSVTLIPANNGQEYRVSGTNELVARLIAYNPTNGNVLELVKTSATARLLLNYDNLNMRVPLGIRARYCGAQGAPTNTYNVTVNDRAFFYVVFQRPINPQIIENLSFTDGLPATQSRISVKNGLIDLYDWRYENPISNFDTYVNYYHYYGVRTGSTNPLFNNWTQNQITVDATQITTNLGHADTFEKVSNYPNLDVDVVMVSVPLLGNQPFLQYQNNENHVSDFIIRVPVTINYALGTIVKTIDIPVVKTVPGN